MNDSFTKKTKHDCPVYSMLSKEREKWRWSIGSQPFSKLRPLS